MISVQDAVKSLGELTASVQDLCSILSSVHSSSRPGKSREELKAHDAIAKTLDEQISKGRPEKILDWKKVELMSVDEIEMENKQFTQKYEGKCMGVHSAVALTESKIMMYGAYAITWEDFWKDIDESTPLEKKAAVQAYSLAFSPFEDIYRLIGWRDRDDKDAMFDKLVLTKSRSLLIESIFGIEAYQMSQRGEFCERSRMLFEHSRLPRLLIILIRIACRQIYVITACGADKVIKERSFDALTVIRVLAFVARTLKSGHLAASLSMETLLHSCYARRILDQPDPSDIYIYRKQFDLLYDCLTALDFTRRFREVREPLCDLFYLRYKSESIYELFERVRNHTEATIGIERFPELPLEENTDSTFHPKIFTSRYLQEFGQLNIEWTDCLDEHLRIYANRNSIRVFAHPTFFYNGVDLHKTERDYMDPTYRELSLTYALLFRPMSSRNLQRLEQYTTAEEDKQILWCNGRPIPRSKPHLEKKVAPHPKKIMDIDPLRYPTKDILLESFYRCSLPPTTQVAFDIASPFRVVKRVTKRLDQHTVTPTSMQQILDLAPNYPEDLKFMIVSVMENSFADMESFVRFPYFAPRLRRLKMYLDSRQPSTIRELWYDRRDYRSWCMFWGAGFFAVCVLLLMLLILLVQIACI